MKKGTKIAKASKPAKGKGKKVVTATMAVEEVVEQFEIAESNHPSHLRRGPVSILQIRELADFLLENAQILNSIATKMERIAIKSIDRVDGVTKGARGKRLIAEFSANLNRAMTDQRFHS